MDTIHSRINIQCKALPGIVALVLASLFNPVWATADADRVAVMWLENGEQDHRTHALLLETDVDIEVHGLLARSEVRQRFFNDTADWAQGRYVFPLPDGAAVDRLNIRIGSRLIEGEIQERQQAAKTYRAARDSGRRAGLVEQERPNLFSTTVANIPPGEEVEIRIGFDQPVDFSSNRFSLRFPSGLAPRFIPGTPLADGPESGDGWSPDTDRVPDASRITPPVQHPDAPPLNPLRLAVNIDPGLALSGVESSHHDVRVEQSGRTWQVELADGLTESDRDFELVWHPAHVDQARTAVFTEQVEGREYALVMMVPPAEFRAEDTPREVILIIDTSGSMRGDPMHQARQSLLYSLDSLGPGDSFNVIEFNHITRSLFDQPVPADDRRLAEARRFVDNLRAGGGTVMGPSLEKAMTGDPAPGHLRQIVFITDGIIGNEAEVLGQIRQDIGQARLFNVGIGHGVNSDFLRRGARHGRGSYTLIAETDQIEARMAELVSRLENPVIHDLELAWPGPAETYPSPLPDLYTGETVSAVARLDQAGGRLEVRGASNGRPWSRMVSLEQAEPARGVAAHWARQKIESISDQNLDRADEQYRRREITETALKYGLLSAHTSLVAVDRTPARSQTDALKAHSVPQNLPRGRELEGFFGQPATRQANTAAMPATDTPAAERIGRGLAALALISLLLLGGRSSEEES